MGDQLAHLAQVVGLEGEADGLKVFFAGDQLFEGRVVFLIVTFGVVALGVFFVCLKLTIVLIDFFVFVFLKLRVVRIGGDFVAVASLRKGFDAVESDVVMVVGDALRSQLQAVEKSGCGLAVDGLVDEGAQDAGDDELDGTTVFEEGECRWNR